MERRESVVAEREEKVEKMFQELREKKFAFEVARQDQMAAEMPAGKPSRTLNPST